MSLTKATEMDVENLLTETGHALSVSDVSDILRLDAVNRRIADGEDCPESIKPTRAVRAGNILLQKPCIGAVEWYEAHAEWFADNAALSDCAFVFASVAKHPRTLWGLTDRKKARRAVRRFMRGLSCTLEDLQAAFVRLYGAGVDAVEITDAPSEEEVAIAVDTICNTAQMNHEATYNAIKNEAQRLAGIGKVEADYGPLISMLCKEYGGEPMTWKWQTPMHIVDACRKDFEARVDAQERELAKVDGASKAPPQKSTRNLLIKEARLIRNEMKARWEATDGA